MGGTAQTLQGAGEKGEVKQAGLAKEDHNNAGNVNVPGAKASKSMKAHQKATVLRKKGKPEKLLLIKSHYRQVNKEV
jgi:hypothetical protein